MDARVLREASNFLAQEEPMLIGLSAQPLKVFRRTRQFTGRSFTAFSFSNLESLSNSAISLALACRS